MINDFVEYWAAAKLLLGGGNPYSPHELLAIEKAVGWSLSEPLMMWNPPWTLSFIFPFGLVDYETAQFVWLLLHVLIIFIGARLLWKIYEGGSQKFRYAWLSALTFAPVYFALLLGQIGPLILLGLIAFLYFAQKEAWLSAGASLSLASVKPHLLYLLWIAILFWLFHKYRWRVAIGALIGGACIAIFPLLWNPVIYFQYAEVLRSGEAVRPLNWATPAPGTALGVLLDSPSSWLRWLPSVGGALWFTWYWSRHSGTWNWISQTPLILLVSVATAGFAWTFDFVVLLPAVIQCAAWTANERIPSQRHLIIATYLLLALVLIAGKAFVRNDFWYFWLAPTLLLFYVWVRARSCAGMTRS